MDAVEEALRSAEHGVVAARAIAEICRERLERREAKRERDLAKTSEEEARSVRKRLTPLALEVIEREARNAAETQALIREERESNAEEENRWRPSDQKHSAIWEGLVRFNVGGQRFAAYAEDLRRGSPWFAALLSGAFPLALDEAGAIFLDRDADQFQVVLDFAQSGYAAVRTRVQALNLRQRRLLLEEAAYVRLPQLVGAVAEPAVGETTMARFTSQQLAEFAGAEESFLHDVCGQRHQLGQCEAQPVACGILGTAVAAFSVRGYRHSSRSGNASMTPAVWLLERHGNLIEATASQLLPSVRAQGAHEACLLASSAPVVTVAAGRE
eukprot:TRINITY_DN67144_c0_g1_i1.p1 TRINITY_DN67144_c0_g1~~TRINITY_DN67144_c0_g1_i1.p1  ORF type:complete len:327 (+),score=71.09 TRINITY_DN67144_c0_g1_i1:72-1052(+)